MKAVLQKHRSKIVYTRNIALIALVASSILTLSKEEAVMFFVPYNEGPLTLNETAEIDVRINTLEPINVIKASVDVSPDVLEIVDAGIESSRFDLWTTEPTISDSSTRLEFTAGTLQRGGLVGTSTVLTFTVKATNDGEGGISFSDVHILAPDGEGSFIPSVERTLSYTVLPSPTTPTSLATGPQGASAIARTPTVLSRPHPDVNGDGFLNLIDVSVFLTKLFTLYDPRFDFNADGSVGLKDLSILLANL